MVDDRIRQEHADLARQPQPEAEINIFAEAEEGLVKPAMCEEQLTVKYGASTAWAEAFPFARQLGRRATKAATPGYAKDQIGIASTVELRRIHLVELGRGKHARIGMARVALGYLLQPVGPRCGIWVEANKPFPACLLRGHVIGSGETMVYRFSDQPERGQSGCIEPIYGAIC